MYWMKDRNKWRVQIGKKAARITKEFDAFEDAVRERLRLESKLFGQFSPQLDMFQQYGIEVNNAI